MEPISIHNLPAHLDATGRPKWDQQKQKPKSHEGDSGDGENAGDTEAFAAAESDERHPPRRGSDGVVGTQVDLEA